MTKDPALDQFPRPHVAVDLAVLTVRPAQEARDRRAALCVLVQQRDEEPSGRVLPGRFIRERHTVEQTIQELLELKLGIRTGHVSPALLRIFGDPDRDGRAWTISVAHAVSLRADTLDGIEGELVPVTSAGGLPGRRRLLFDHDEIVHEAVDQIRHRYESAPDPDGLLKPPFTLGELRRLHEAVLGEAIRKDTFNRRMKPQLEGLEEDDGSQRTRTSIGRPAQLFHKAGGRSLSSLERWRLPRAE